MQLVRVSEDVRNVRGEAQFHFDTAGANGVTRNIESGRHDFVHCDRTALRWLLTSHCEEGPNDTRTALGGGTNFRCRGQRGHVALLLEEYGSSNNDRKRIIELMSDAGEQRTERGKFFALV